MAFRDAGLTLKHKFGKVTALFIYIYGHSVSILIILILQT